MPRPAPFPRTAGGLETLNGDLARAGTMPVLSTWPHPPSHSGSYPHFSDDTTTSVGLNHSNG